MLTCGNKSNEHQQEFLVQLYVGGANLLELKVKRQSILGWSQHFD
jgi:hypothetical protein